MIDSDSGGKLHIASALESRFPVRVPVEWNRGIGSILAIGNVRTRWSVRGERLPDVNELERSTTDDAESEWDTQPIRG